MAQQSCGASVQCCAIRITALELDGVPVPGPKNLYVTDALAKFEATPVYAKGVDMEVLNACGIPSVLYKARDSFKRFDLSLSFLNIDPEVEALLIGNLVPGAPLGPDGFVGGITTISQSGFVVGASTLNVAGFGNPFGVSIELWSKHIVNGDIDTIWPYIQWIIPRSYWQPDKVVWDNNPMPRDFMGFTTENPNYFNGPLNDWLDTGPNSSATRSLAYRFTKTLPNPACGAQSLVSS